MEKPMGGPSAWYCPDILVFLNDHLLATFSQGNPGEDVWRENYKFILGRAVQSQNFEWEWEIQGFETKTNNIMFI